MKFIFRIVLFVSVIFIQCKKEKTQSKPNVLFIFADDLTYEAIGGLGHPIVKTPHIDDLIENGTTYSHAYNMGGWHGAICVASRTMLMSGRSIWRAKAIEEKWGNKDSVSLNQTWPNLMASAGYDTYMTGKWHIRASAKEVFDIAQNIRGGNLKVGQK
jgi:arylsulfatase A-like enzyme